MASLKNQFKLSSGDRYFIARECGGTVSLDDVVELLQKTDDYEDGDKIQGQAYFF